MKVNKSPKISVVMPAYNAELYIARAIESILKQTFKEFELIIINDKSLDNTLKIAKKYSKLDRRIRIINNTKNLKISKTLNKGIKYSKAEFIARMDADDVSEPERFEMQYKYLKKHPSVAIVGTYMKILNGLGDEVAQRVYPTQSHEMKKVIFKYSPFSHPSVMYRKEVVKEFGGYDESLACEDTDLWFKVGVKYDFANIPRFLLRYTVANTSSSFKKLRKIELDGLKIKIKAIVKLGYRPSFGDILYNVGEYATLWLMPPSFRIWLYTILRGKGII